MKEAQSLAVKRAEVEFHNFASLGQPDRAMAHYADQNIHRAALIRKHLGFIGELSPFLEIGANVGHTSYLLANEFGAEGFALDISADSLRHGIELQNRWQLPLAPIRIAGDAVNLPFADGSLRFVMAFQTLSQFLNLESLFLEVQRVLAPGGTFLFAEEPLKRLLTLRLYRCPYYDTMKPWERKLSDWGLLGYLVRDVIGAHQEESFGIRQNHTMGLKDWHRLIHRYFPDAEYEIFVPERGWGERVAKRAAVRLDPFRSEWRAARLLGGTLAAFCRKAGDPCTVSKPLTSLLRCPDCHFALHPVSNAGLACTRCAFRAAEEGGVYNLLPSEERAELYPGDRADTIDFTLAGHEHRLLDGWHELEGVFGNKYRWMGTHAAVKLGRVRTGPQRLRIRGHASEGHPVELTIRVNGDEIGNWKLDRPGLFVLEADVPDAPEYRIEIQAGPPWQAPGDARTVTANIGMIQLIPRGAE